MNCNLCGENHETAKCPELEVMLEMVADLWKQQYPHAATAVIAAKERIEALEAENKIATDALRVIANLRAGAVDSGDAWQPIEEAERALAAIAKAKGGE